MENNKPNFLAMYQNAINEEKSNMTQDQLEEFNKNEREEARIVSEHEKNMVRDYSETDYTTPENEEDFDSMYPEADEPSTLVNCTDEIKFDDTMAERKMAQFEKEEEERRTKAKEQEADMQRKFEETKKIMENQIKETALNIERVEVKPVIVKAYCPHCGKEIINKTPVMFNPFSMEKVCMYECECGWKANLEYAYPRVEFVDDNNNIYNAYTK